MNQAERTSLRYTNRVQVTPTISPPAWQDIGTGTPGGDGVARFAHTNGWWQTQRFYPLIWP